MVPNQSVISSQLPHPILDGRILTQDGLHVYIKLRGKDDNKYFLYATIASAPTTKISSLVNQYDPDTAFQPTKGSK